MKKLMIAVLTLVSIKSLAMVTSVDENSKTVNWTPDNTLQVNTVIIDSDDNNYAFLSLKWTPDSDSFKNEYNQLTTRFPGYQIVRNDIEGIQGFKVTIPSAGYSKNDINPLPGANGPFFNMNDIISRTTYGALLRARKENASSYIQVQGTAAIHETKSVVIESYSLTPKICQSLLGHQTMEEVQANLLAFAISNERNQTPKQSQPRDLLNKAAQSACFELSNSVNITSFKDLMRIPLKMAITEPIVVSYSQKSSEPKSFPIPTLLTPWVAN